MPLSKASKTAHDTSGPAEAPGAVHLPCDRMRGEDACILLLDADGHCLHATPLAAPLVPLLSAPEKDPTSLDQTTLPELIRAARRTGSVSVGTVGAPDERLDRVFDLSVIPAAPESGHLLVVGHDVTLPTSMRRT